MPASGSQQKVYKMEIAEGNCQLLDISIVTGIFFICPYSLLSFKSNIFSSPWAVTTFLITGKAIHPLICTVKHSLSHWEVRQCSASADSKWDPSISFPVICPAHSCGICLAWLCVQCSLGSCGVGAGGFRGVGRSLCCKSAQNPLLGSILVPAVPQCPARSGFPANWRNWVWSQALCRAGCVFMCIALVRVSPAQQVLPAWADVWRKVRQILVREEFRWLIRKSCWMVLVLQPPPFVGPQILVWVTDFGHSFCKDFCCGLCSSLCLFSVGGQHQAMCEYYVFVGAVLFLFVYLYFVCCIVSLS